METKKNGKKEEVSSLLWTGVRIFHADPDEEPDATEADDQITAADSVVADENLHSEEGVERVRAVVGRNMPRSADLEVALQPVLMPNEAKCYARSAAPTSRGRMCLNILNVADTRVFV